MFLPDDARVEHLDHLARRREGAAFARSKSTPRGPAAAARSRSAAGRGDAERGRGVAGVVGRGRDRGGEDTVGGVGGGAAARVREDATARVVVGEESRGDSALGYSAFGFDARTADERGSARAGRFRGASSNVFARRAPVRGNAGVAGVHLVRKETLRPRWHEWGSARRAESPRDAPTTTVIGRGFHGRGSRGSVANPRRATRPRSKSSELDASSGDTIPRTRVPREYTSARRATLERVTADARRMTLDEGRTVGVIRRARTRRERARSTRASCCARAASEEARRGAALFAVLARARRRGYFESRYHRLMIRAHLRNSQTLLRHNARPGDTSHRCDTPVG